MLDLGFFEIALIGIVAVLVLGPEKLPEAIAGVMRFLRKIKSFISETKDSIDKELQIEELKKEAQTYKDELMSASKQLDELSRKEIANPIQKEVSEMKKVEKEVTLKKESAKLELKSLLSKQEKKDV
jgi:sec-independent protein translocase protein TatB